MAVAAAGKVKNDEGEGEGEGEGVTEGVKEGGRDGEEGEGGRREGAPQQRPVAVS